MERSLERFAPREGGRRGSTSGPARRSGGRAHARGGGGRVRGEDGRTRRDQHQGRGQTSELGLGRLAGTSIV